MKHSPVINRALVTITVLVLVVGFASVLRAYTAPTSTPPNGNVAAPINVGPVTQLKQGTLGALTGVFTSLWAIDYSSGTGKGLVVGPNGAFILDGTTPVAGRVLTQGPDGRALWGTGGTGSFPAGTNNQTIRYDGTTPVATGSVEVGSGGEVWMATLADNTLPNGYAPRTVCAETNGRLVICPGQGIQQGGQPNGNGNLQTVQSWQDFSIYITNQLGVGILAYAQLFSAGGQLEGASCADTLAHFNFGPLDNDPQNVRARLTQSASWNTGKCAAICNGWQCPGPVDNTMLGPYGPEFLIDYGQSLPANGPGKTYWIDPYFANGLFQVFR